jgi:membrane protein YdbS with pleckstrin-like domain
MGPGAAGGAGMARREWDLYAAAALSLFAALIHLWVTPEHFEEWWG